MYIEHSLSHMLCLAFWTEEQFLGVSLENIIFSPQVVIWLPSFQNIIGFMTQTAVLVGHSCFKMPVRAFILNLVLYDCFY